MIYSILGQDSYYRYAYRYILLSRFNDYVHIEKVLVDADNNDILVKTL